MSNKKYNRRSILKASSFLTASACFSNPLQQLIHSLLGGMVSNAMAKDQLLNPRSYVFIRLGGGPPRWTWDPLCPFDDPSRIMSNVQVVTAFTNNGNSIAYKTKKIKGINMPWLWQYDIARAGGGSRPLHELMDDLLIMRGVNCGNPGHNGASVLQYQPSGLAYSLMSMTADNGHAAIPHINIKSRYRQKIPYISQSGVGGVFLNTGRGYKPLKRLLEPFQGQASENFTTNRNKIDRQIKEAIQSLGDLAMERHPGASQVIISQKYAEELLRGGFNDLVKIYDDLFAKYDDIVNRTKTKKNILAGINDKKINANWKGSNRPDLASTVETRAMAIAEQFAVTEFVLKNQLSQSISFEIGGLDGFDEHTFDPKASLYFNTLLNRSLGACTLELKDQLLTKNLWDETLINISGEFGRFPTSFSKDIPKHADHNFGSNHSPHSGSVTLLSGCLKGREIIGNIRRNSNYKRGTSFSSGTCGWQASNPEFGLLSNANLANTIATILRVPEPLTAAKTVVKEDRGIVSSLLPPGKLIG